MHLQSHPCTPFSTPQIASSPVINSHILSFWKDMVQSESLEPSIFSIYFYLEEMNGYHQGFLFELLLKTAKKNRKKY